MKAFLALFSLIFSFLPVFLFSQVGISRIAVQKKYLVISIYSDSTNQINLAGIAESGVALKVSYSISLFQKGAFPAPDGMITNINLILESKKDIINNGFETEVTWANDKRGHWFAGSGELLDYLLTVRNFKFFQLDRLEKDKKYYLEVQQNITSLEIYPPLSWLFGLFQTWSYTSGKVKSKIFNKYGIINE